MFRDDEENERVIRVSIRELPARKAKGKRKS